jgi:hypothetical protein
MINFFKKQNGIIEIVLVLFLYFSVSCKTKKQRDTVIKDTVNQVNNSVFSKNDKSKMQENNNFLEIKTKSIIFYALDRSEYEEFIRENGQYSKYEFDELLNRFRRMENIVGTALKSQKINAIYSSAKEFHFTLKNGQTFIFNRVKEGKFMGQLFFDGVNPPQIEDGMIEAGDLKEIIKKYYKVAEIKDIIDDSAKTDSQKIIGTDNNEGI